MSFCYDNLWRIRFDDQRVAQARVHLTFPSVDAVSLPSFSGTLVGRVFLPMLTDAEGSPVLEGSCTVDRSGERLRLTATLPFRSQQGRAQLSVWYEGFGIPPDDALAHVRLEGDGVLAPQQGLTKLYLPRFVTALRSLDAPAEPAPRRSWFATWLGPTALRR